MPLRLRSHSAACCSMLQCVAVCCSVLQCVAVCCSVLQCVAACFSVLPCVALYAASFLSSVFALLVCSKRDRQVQTWLIYMYGMTHSCVCYDPSYVSHHAFIRMT